MTKNDLFEVEKIQLGPVNMNPFVDENGKAQAGTPELNLDMKLPASFGMYRTDNGTCLGVVGNQYHPVQNSELLDVVSKAADIANLPSDSIDFMEFGGGRRVSFQVQLPNWDLGDDDHIERYVSALNSHDGSASLGLGLVGIRIFCSNTWTTAHKACRRVRHSSGIMEQVKEISEDMLRTIEIDKDLFVMFQKMKNEAYNDEQHDKFIEQVLGYSMADLEKVEESGKNVTQRRNTFTDIAECVDIELESAGRNMWGVFNGITQYTNHRQAVNKPDPDYYLYFGGGKKLADKALDVLGYNS